MTKRAPVQLLYDAKAAIGESPLWWGGSLWWTDPVERQLLCGRSSVFQAIPVPQHIWSLAELPAGTLVGSLDDRFARIDRDGVIHEGPAASVAQGCRFNDMTAGPDGALWVGAMHRGLLVSRGGIFRADAIGAAPEQVAEGLGVPNGMKLSPDGKTLFVIDTLQRTLLAYPVEGRALGEPLIVTDFLGLPGKPDGMTLAPDGSFWVAMWGGGCVVRIAPDGAMLDQIDVPAPHVSSLCFTGDDRLLISTSRMRMSPDALQKDPHSGGIFAATIREGA